MLYERPLNGVQDERPSGTLFINAVVHVNPSTTLPACSLWIQNGIIKGVGKNLSVTGFPRINDLHGKHLYPSFIDLFTTYGLPIPPKASYLNEPQLKATKKGPYSWNDAIRPYQRAKELFQVNTSKAEEYLQNGFGSVLTHYPDGLSQGTSALVTLGSKKENEVLLLPDAATHFSFSKGSSSQSYPSSLMGSIALLRQTELDATWYSSLKNKKETDLALESYLQYRALPRIFEADDIYNVLRVLKIGAEFDIKYLTKTSGNDYKRLEELKQYNGRLIVPICFPPAYEAEDPINAQYISIQDLWHWEKAPYNPYLLFRSGIVFAFTMSDLKDSKQFLTNLRKAVQAGLPTSEALKALTTRPAEWIGVSDQLGTLSEGKIANFFISTDSIFNEEARITAHWIQGTPTLISDPYFDNWSGKYEIAIIPDYKAHIKNTMTIKGKAGSPEVFWISNDTVKPKVNLSRERDMIHLKVMFEKDSNGANTLYMSGWFTDRTFYGTAFDEKGLNYQWKAVLTDSTTDIHQSADTTSKESISLAPINSLPPGTLGRYTTTPVKESVIFKNATVWTNEQEGILQNYDVLIQNGLITAIGKNLTPPKDVIEINASGKHLTSGIIDEHSHIAITGGVNECSNSVTSEVRIEDVINCEDVNIYRNLSGGVTAVQVLHGSCNAIGGQSALIRLKWGKSPEEMLIKNTDGFIKFALGENVKQSNWGEKYYTRYPQTRMGVQQIYLDAFQRSQKYLEDRQEYKKVIAKEKSKGISPRKDLQLEALSEILTKKRYITCHSYVQSEINMLIKTLEPFGIQVNTFTHILEGYKMSDKLRMHHIGASTFSDWWSYKMEVSDAIPYNAALMSKAKVITAINSDDAEMARRLNQEAAKTIKYGNLSEEEAWKTVTINPAKLLHLDKRMGSIKIGKDADLVLWSGNPLSVYSKAEKTWIEGECYFNREKEEERLSMIKKEKARLIAVMLNTKSKGETLQKPLPNNQHTWDCEETTNFSAF